ncbi:hypothetical protein EVB99_010 [Rhizobium phage RHph_N3_19]|nr:hypothetical protein EVB99_010 [Rhizobium phage RHph_N3_19]
MIKRSILLVAAAMSVAVLSACTDADIASDNIKKAADNFEVNRRVVYFAVVPMKGIEYLLQVEGRCSLGNFDSNNELTITCKEGERAYKKHFFGFNSATPVSYFVEQGDVVDVNAYHTRIIFKPQSIIPDIDFKGSSGELMRNAGD